MIRVLVALYALSGVAWADAETEADAAFRAAEQRVAAGDPKAIDALEALGAARPVTRWTDDAWLEAGRLAERAADYPRARRDYAQAVSTATDDHLARRAQGALDRITAVTGPTGQWSEVAAEHDRLAARVLAGGDPKPALHELEALVRAHPGYPRAATAMMTIALGYTRDGALDRALDWLREARRVATGSDREVAAAAVVRALIRRGDLDAAHDELAALQTSPGVHAQLDRTLSTAELRRTIRWILEALLTLVATVAAVVLRHRAGSWRAALRRLARPPAEVLYLAPIAVVLVIVAWSGNPLVASAVRVIAGAGIAIAWLSGALLAGGRMTLRSTLVHAALVVLAVAATVYIAIDRQQLIDLLIETWHEGPAPR